MSDDLDLLIKGISAFIQKKVPPGRQREFLNRLLLNFFKPGEQAFVYSTVVLKPEIKEKLEKYIRSLSPVSEINFFLDKKLLGGIKIKIGDNLIDKSLVGRIDQIQNQ